MSLAEVAIPVIPDFGQFGPRLRGELPRHLPANAADEHGRRIGASFSQSLGGGARVGIAGLAKTMFAPIAAAAGAVAGIRFLGGMIDEARESNRMSAITAAAIKSTGAAAKITADQVGGLANALSVKTGVDDEAVQSGENLLLTFTNIRNETGKGNDIFNQASATVLDMTAALNNGAVSADGVKASSIQLGKALNDPIAGISALSRVGVSFTEQQKAQIKTLVQSGDVMGAQKIILAELGKEFGGAAAAAADPMQKLGVVVGNLKERLGLVLLPVIAAVATWLGPKLVTGLDLTIKGFTVFFNALRGRSELNEFEGGLKLVNNAGIFLFELFRRLFEGAKVFFSALTGRSELNEFEGGLRTLNNAGIFLYELWRNQISPALQAFGGFLTGTVIPAVSSFGGFLTGTVIPAVSSFGGFLGNNTDLIVALATGLGVLKVGFMAYHAVLGVVEIATKAWALAQGLLNVVLSASPIGIVIVALAALAAGLVYAYQNSATFRDIVSNAFQVVSAIAQNFWQNFAQPVLSGLATAFVFAGNTAVSFWRDFLSPVLTFAGNMFRSFWFDFAVPVFNAFVAAWIFTGNTAMSFWTNFLSPVINFMVGALQFSWGIITTWQNIVNGALTAVGNWFLATWNTWIFPFFQNIATWINNAVGWFLAMPGRIAAALSAIGSVVANAVKDAWNGAAGWINNNVISKVNAVTGIFNVKIPGLPTFAVGGWTGAGGKYEPAGIVHADEFVVRKESQRSMREQFPGLLDYINERGTLPGYYDGGMAKIIYSVGKGMGASDRDILVSFMAALQESGMVNVPYGDRDSLGLFQMRPSTGWGTPAQIMDPVYSSRKFFQALFAVKNRDNLSLTAEAQAVERSAFPMAYAKWENLARQIFGQVTRGGVISGIISGVTGFIQQATGDVLAAAIKAIVGMMGKIIPGNSFVEKWVEWIGTKWAEGAKTWGDNKDAEARRAGGGAFGGVPAPPASGNLAILPGDFVRTTFQGKAMNVRTARLLQAAAANIGRAISVIQGSYSTSVAASGGTHAGGGVIDVGPAIKPVETGLRNLAFAAWIRDPSQGPWGWHIHAVDIHDPTASPQAKAQVQSYLRGGTGLGSHAFGGLVPAGAYDSGGWLPPGATWAINNTGAPERVIGPRETIRLDRADLDYLADRTAVSVIEGIRHGSAWTARRVEMSRRR